MKKTILAKLGWLSSLWLLGALLIQLPPQTVLADDSTSSLWPTEVTHIGIFQNLNPVWGSAVSSDVNWVYNTQGDMPFTHVIVVDGVAYVGAMMNQFYALDALTGKLAWKFEANNWIMTNPVVAEGKVFIGSGNRDYPDPNPTGLRGTGPNSLYALDAKTGQQIWKYDVAGEAMPTPLYHNGIVYYVTGDRNLYALNASSGELVFKYDLGSVFSMGSINIDGDMLVFSGGNPVKAFGFNLKTRNLAWVTAEPFIEIRGGIDDSNPAIANGVMYINGVEYDSVPTGKINPRHVFFALDTRTGAVKWKFNAGWKALIDDNKASTPVIVDGTYYGAASGAARFYALDASTGAVKWSLDSVGVVKGNPVVVDNFVIFADTKGNVYTVNRTNGKLIKKLALGGNIAPQGPTVFNGTVYLANQGTGKIYAFSLTTLTGETLRHTPEAIPANTGFKGVLFPETGHAVSGVFLDFWNKHGGLTSLGYPITGEIQEFHAAEGKTYTVQYFERARLELHDNTVLLGRLGSEVTANRMGKTVFQPVSKPASGTYYSVTGHTVLPQFEAYWQRNGGLARFGYPISEPLQEKSSDGQVHTVQYFERARFELHDNNTVLLGLIGSERLVLQAVK
jgi:outer membrane protein assembly factor BamB